MIKTIVVYINHESFSAEQLMQAISSSTDIEIENVRSHEALKRFLNQVPTSEVMIVYAVYDRHDLRFIRSLREGGKHSKLILVLPDSNEQTFSEGLLANPSFITCAYDNFGDVSAVVEKIVNTTDYIQ